jgi:hypothetical protein
VPSAAADALWDAAVAHTGSTQELEAGTVEMFTWQLDGNGEISEETRMLFSRSIAEPAGSTDSASPPIRNRLVEAEVNGEKQNPDELDSMEKKMQDRMEGDSRHGNESRVDPFAPSVQKNIEYRVLEQEVDCNGRPCRLYRFTLPSTDRKGREIRYVGRAWLDSEEGRPVRITYAPDPMPGPLKDFRGEHNYGYGDSQRWLLRSVVVEIRAQVLFVRKHFITETRFTDYFPVK